MTLNTLPADHSKQTVEASVSLRRHQRGMTLLEVMVALLIFALTGTAIMKAASDNLHNVTSIEEITFATWVANNRLTELQLDNSWPPKNNLKGSEEMADRTWYWRQVVKETADKDMRMVEIEVRAEENALQSITSVSSFLARTQLTNGKTGQ